MILYRKKTIDYFVATMFVITSGAVFYVYALSPAITYVILLVIGFFNKMRVKSDLNCIRIDSNSSWLYILFVSVLAIIGLFYYQYTYDDRNLVGYLVLSLASYFIISTYSFTYFRKLLTNVVFVIVLLGIPVYYINEFNFLPTSTLVTSHEDTYTMFLCYTLGWPHLFHRFSGIWHEPGACQIVLNTILWLHFNKIVKWEWERYELVKIVIIGIGALITLSTGSYLSIMLLLLSVAVNLKIRTKHRTLLYGFVVFFLVFAFYFVFNSDTVQNKLFNEDSQENQLSTVSRTADAIALWEMTMERPFLGYGLGTHDYWKTSTDLGNTANSSGLLTFSASFGMIWLIVFIVVIYRRIFQMGFGKASVLLLLAVLIMQFNEKYIEYPITNIFIFSFSSYFLKNSKPLTYETTENNNSDSNL